MVWIVLLQCEVNSCNHTMKVYLNGLSVGQYIKKSPFIPLTKNLSLHAFLIYIKLRAVAHFDLMAPN